MNNRAKKLATVMAKQNAKPVTCSSTPTLPAGDIEAEESAKMDAIVDLDRLSENLNKAGLSFSKFVSEQLNLKLAKPQRSISTPFGEEYTVVSRHFINEELSSRCKIDSDNVRDPSERTEEALADIIDEIGSGFQIQPAIAYIDNENKVSIVDGSRRFECAMLRNGGLDIDIFDKKPTEETVRWIIEVSDRKKKFSYFEKGKLFSALMESNNWTQQELVNNRKYTKQEVSRCLNVSNAPEDILRLLKSKDMTKEQAEHFGSSVNTLVKYGKLSHSVDELSFELNNRLTHTEQEELKFIIKWLKNKATEVKGNKIAKASKSIELFSSGKTKVVYNKTSGVKSELELRSLPESIEKEIIESVEKILKRL